jgi:voltage-gated potassium channel
VQKSIHYLRELVDDPATAHGKRFMLAIQFLIVVSITSFTLETLPGRSDLFYLILTWLEVVTIGIFTLEYILRLLVSEQRLKFVMSFWGVVDLLSIVPFYIFLLIGFDSRPLKALRMLRLLRLFKIFRYNKSIHRFKRALSIAKDDLVLFGATALIMIYLSGVGVYFLENERQPEQFSSILDGVWWSIVTLTTVGYGDTYPITAGGRVFTFIILIIGLAIVSIPTGLIASALTQARNEGKEI